MNKSSLKKLISFFLLFAIIALLFCCIVSYLQYNRLSKSYNNLIQSYQTIRASNQSLISIDEAALSLSTFLQTKDTEILQKVPQFIIAATINFETLKQLVRDNNAQTEIVNKLTPLFENKISFLNQIMDRYSKGKVQEAFQIAGDKDRLRKTSEIAQLLIQIKQMEITQLNDSNESLKIYKHHAYILISYIGILTGVLFLACFICLNKYFKKY
jgi:CHASE3 domain sensor protein